jgi:hypothetical protein
VRQFVFLAIFAAALVLLGLGLLSLIIGKNLLTMIPWWAIMAYVLLIASTSIVEIRAPINALWRALRADYPGEPLAQDNWPQSGGIFGTTGVDDIDAATSFARESGLSICRYRRFTKTKSWVEIPWSRVESVELMEPDASGVDLANSRGKRRALSALLTAKIKLIRDRNPMTLVMPWNEEFASFAPPDVQIIKEWEWPYSVM